MNTGQTGRREVHHIRDMSPAPHGQHRRGGSRGRLTGGRGCGEVFPSIDGQGRKPGANPARPPLSPGRRPSSQEPPSTRAHDET